MPVDRSKLSIRISLIREGDDGFSSTYAAVCNVNTTLRDAAQEAVEWLEQAILRDFVAKWKQ